MQGGQDQLLLLLTQPVYSIDRYTMKHVNQALENKDTYMIHKLCYGPKWCFSIQINQDTQGTLIVVEQHHYSYLGVLLDNNIIIIVMDPSHTLDL